MKENEETKVEDDKIKNLEDENQKLRSELKAQQDANQEMVR